MTHVHHEHHDGGGIGIATGMIVGLLIALVVAVILFLFVFGGFGIRDREAPIIIPQPTPNPTQAPGSMWFEPLGDLLVA